MSQPYYVTTPIYYVNDVPHIGHCYTTIAADVLARFFRAAGRDVRFLTGTDEHGVKMVKAAETKGVAPNALADENAPQFKKMWETLNISNDDFIRTTEPRHESRVQAVIRLLLERDEIYRGSYEGWYDEGQEEYVTESTARDNDYKSEINGQPLVRYSEENWFFRLQKWAPKLVEYIEANPEFIQPKARRNEVLSKLKMGLEDGSLSDLCISRNKSKLPWGVEMPNDPEHVVYVWVDALSNYTNALGMPDVGDEWDGKFASYWPANVHLIGKDILWFHAVYWPCILMALDWPLPKTVFAHGWWTSEGQKMSKSLGNFISREVIHEICEEYHRDVLRYYLLRAMSFGQDGDFSRDTFKQTYNNDLANGVGNLISRTVKMIGKYFDGVLPEAGFLDGAENDVIAAAAAVEQQAPEMMESCAFHKYLELILDLVNATNRFIDDTEPFKLAKDETQRERLGAILRVCAESIRKVLLALEPFLPEKAAAGLAMLGLDNTEALQTGWRVAPGEPLFPRKQ